MEKPPVNTTNKIEPLKAEQSVEHFSLSEQKKNIQEVFKLCPELQEIGNEEQYQEYLKTIFPESKYKEII